MHTVIAHLKSVTPYSQSKYVQVSKKDKEAPDAYEERTWKNRMHVTEDGNVFIPPMAFKHCVAEAARFLSISIKGRGKATYTKHFKSGILCIDPVVLPDVADEVKGEWLFVPSDGRPGGQRRVMKCFPCIPKWEAEVRFEILDDTIPEDIFRYVLEEAGKFIGIGRFRPQNGGFYGRFVVEDMVWE